MIKLYRAEGIRLTKRDYLFTSDLENVLRTWLPILNGKRYIAEIRISKDATVIARTWGDKVGDGYTDLFKLTSEVVVKASKLQRIEWNEVIIKWRDVIKYRIVYRLSNDEIKILRAGDYNKWYDIAEKIKRKIEERR